MFSHHIGAHGTCGIDHPHSHPAPTPAPRPDLMDGRDSECRAQYGSNPDLCHQPSGHRGTHSNRYGTTWTDPAPRSDASEPSTVDAGGLSEEERNSLPIYARDVLVWAAVARIVADREERARAEALREAADEWSEWEVFVAADGHRALRQHGLDPADWLRDRAPSAPTEGEKQ